MKMICNRSCLCVLAAMMVMAVHPSSAEAGRRHRRRAVYVARPHVHAPVYVVPAPRYDRPYYYPPVNVVTPRVRVHVGGYGGVRVHVGGWYFGW